MNFFPAAKITNNVRQMTLVFCLILGVANTSQAQFKITIKTDNPGTSDDHSFTIPTTAGGYNYDVDWHDDGIIDEYGVTGSITHDYGRAGTFEIAIYGNFPRIYFSNGGDRLKLISINQWGSIAWSAMGKAFEGCTNMTYEATDSPNLSGVSSLFRMFAGCTQFDGDLSNWDTSNITNMKGMFIGATNFNQDISGWDVSSVVDMSSLFSGASSFNQDLSSWNVSNATNMTSTFKDASSFNQSLGSWDISSVTDMAGMLRLCGMTGANYDATLIGWEAQNEPTGISLGAVGRTYCNSSEERSNLITLSGWSISGDTQDCSSEVFTITVKTDNPGTSNNTSFTIPTHSSPTYDYRVDWDNDGTFDDTGVSGNITHDYGVAGTYQISIAGDFPRIYFNSSGDRLKVLSIDQWGSIKWTNMLDAFKDCSNMTYSASDTPRLSSVSNMARMFKGCSSLDADLSTWDVSNITNMQGLFWGASSFSHDISSWDTGSVNNFSSILRECSAYDYSLENWEFGPAAAFNNMLNDCGMSTYNYDKTISHFLSTGLSNKTFGAIGLTYCNSETSRDQLIANGWTISDGGKDCTDDNVFFKVTVKTNNPGWSNNRSFTIPVSNNTYNYDVDWNGDGTFDEFGLTGSVTHDYGVAGTYQIAIKGTFPHINFNNGGDRRKVVSLDQWGTINWESMINSFYGCSTMTYLCTDAPILNSVTSMLNMFRGCSSFDGDLSNWDVSNITVLKSMFEETNFNQDISGWDVSGVIDFNRVFMNNSAFNQDISGWDLSSAEHIRNIFNNATSFNQDIGNWNISSVIDIAFAFNGASSFDQNLGNWDISSVVDFNSTFNNCGMSTRSYDDTLIGWEANGVQPNMTLGASGLTYCASATARLNLINNDGWSFIGDDYNCYELPVELIDFKAKYLSLNQSVELEWSTALELNNDRFELERSLDGKNFSTIAEIEGNGTTNEISLYYYTDYNLPSQSKIYYRLTQIDYDGTTEHLKIVAVNLSLFLDSDISVYPNPVGNSELLHVDLMTIEEFTSGHVQLFNQSGKQLNIPILITQSGLSLNLNRLNDGIYILKFNAADRVITRKIQKTSF